MLKPSWSKALSAALLVFSASLSGAAGYGEISKKLIAGAKAGGAARIGVLQFSAKGGAVKAEAEYAGEKIEESLAVKGAPELVERASLQKILREARLARTADGGPAAADGLRAMLSVDAVVTGAVFPSGGKLKIFARLVEVKTGRVLALAAGEEDREDFLPEDPFSETGLEGLGAPAVPGHWNPAVLSPSSSAFRDAMAELNSPSCGERRRELAKANARLVEDKALYWASRMKEPGFSISGLRRNPGSEIADPGVKSAFYQSLSAYYREAASKRLDSARLEAVLTLIRSEEDLSNECGLN